MTCFRRIKSALLMVGILLALIVQSKSTHAQQLQTLTVAGGCFWCVEADFEKVPGVQYAVSGFTGGLIKNPTYKQVTRGGTGHFEAVQISFDSDVVSLDTLLDLFFRSIDPTDTAGQFCDRGDSYRSAVFVTENQRPSAIRAKEQAQAALGQTIVTPILAKVEFYPVDEYHQNFYKQSKLILTRFGPKSKAKAYKAYRESCGRDARIRELWGDKAAFAGG